MPVSPYHYVSRNCELLVREFPTSVLDVGVGHGKWGFLCRDALEAFVGSRYFKRDWKIRIDGIEIFEAYHNPVWDYAYDHVWIGNAADLVPRADVYDVIIAMEVIEHLDKAPAARLVDEMVRHAVRGVVLSFPEATDPDALAKEESYGNPHEQHRSLWSPADFAHYRCEELGPNHVFVRDPGKTRIPAADLRDSVRGGHVVREAAKGCEQPPVPWLVLTEPGSALTLALTARQIHLYFVKHVYCGGAEVWIDGRLVETIPMWVPGAAEYACWRSAVLPVGDHRVEVRAVADPATGHGEVWLDDVVLEL